MLSRIFFIPNYPTRLLKNFFFLVSAFSWFSFGTAEVFGAHSLKPYTVQPFVGMHVINTLISAAKNNTSVCIVLFILMGVPSSEPNVRDRCSQSMLVCYTAVEENGHLR